MSVAEKGAHKSGILFNDQFAAKVPVIDGYRVIAPDPVRVIGKSDDILIHVADLGIIKEGPAFVIVASAFQVYDDLDVAIHRLYGIVPFIEQLRQLGPVKL